jgi:hypothetical protein
MPATVDKLLGRPLLHSHQVSDLVVSSGALDITSSVTVTDDVVADSETMILADASLKAITITLPQASTVMNKLFKIKKIDSSTNTVTIDGYNTETIDGETAILIAYQNSAVQIVSNGSNWFII